MANLSQNIYDSVRNIYDLTLDLSPKEVWEGAVIRFSPDVCVMRDELKTEYPSDAVKDILYGNYEEAADDLDLKPEALEEKVKNEYWDIIEDVHDVYRVDIAGYGPYEGPNSRKAVILEKE